MDLTTQTDLAAAFAHIPGEQREQVAAAAVAAARAFIRAESANDAMDEVLTHHLPVEAQLAIGDAKKATSEAVESTWNVLQETCFAHNVDSSEVLLAVRAEREQQGALG